MRYLVLLCAFTLPLAMLTGCGSSKTGGVTGVVTLDGLPVANAGVAFRPELGGRMSTGETDEQGKYSLSCYERNDGAVPGTHKVTVTKFEESKRELPENVDETMAELMSAGARPAKKKWIVPEKYSDQGTSDLTFTVEKGSNTANFDLQSN